MIKRPPVQAPGPGEGIAVSKITETVSVNLNDYLCVSCSRQAHWLVWWVPYGAYPVFTGNSLSRHFKCCNVTQ